MELPALTCGVLLRRYKRFFADVALESGETVTAHCPNTGAMTGCAEAGSRVWLSRSDNPKRKLNWTWQLVETAHGIACIHSALANRVIAEAITDRRLESLPCHSELAKEVAVEGGSRIDFLLSKDDQRYFVEVKAVTLCRSRGLGVFPDVVSDRALKHVQALSKQVAQGAKAALVFCALHNGIERVAPAVDIQPAYGRALVDAVQAGVLVSACRVDCGPQGLRPLGEIPVELE